MENKLNEAAEYLLTYLKACNDEEIVDSINDIILELTKESKKENLDINYVGYNIDINPMQCDIKDLNLNIDYYIESNPFYIGFIPEDTKIIYGYSLDRYLKISSKGYYYYMNDYDYLYKFAKYIKDKEVESDEDFVLYAYFFIKNYLGNSNLVNRDNLHKLILNSNEMCYEPSKEHSISDFKGNGAALCSEYSALMQNILSLFYYDSVYIIGNINDSKEVDHAFNLTVLNDSYYLLDTTYGANCFNETCSKVISLPYLMELEDFSEEDFQNFIAGVNKIELDDYQTHVINDSYFNFPINQKRLYKIQGRNLSIGDR